MKSVCYPLIVEHPDFSVRKIGNGWLLEDASGDQLLLSGGYREGSLFVQEDPLLKNQDLLLVRIAIECRLAWEGVVFLHSACVGKNGMAVAFTGESGMGKSTRAAHWVHSLGAQWISGDRPGLQTDTKMIYGLPWDGKEQIFCNMSIPLYALLDVRRGSNTSLRQLSKTQMRRLLMQQCFLPMWDNDTAYQVVCNVEKLLHTLPGYRLTCDMTADAALDTAEILFNSPEKIRKETFDMKIKEGFILRKLMGEYMVMPTGNNVSKFGGSVVLNEVAAFVYEKLLKPVSREELLEAILEEYEVEKQVAESDLDALLEKLSSFEMLDKQP